MFACVLSKLEQRNVCERMCDFLKSICVVSKAFTDPAEFWSVIKLSAPHQIDFIIIDYRIYQLDIFNPYKEMLRSGNIIPIVFYNDPYPEPDARAAYWKTKNKMYFVPHINSSVLDNLYPVWKKLEEYLNSPEVNPYLTVIRQNAALTDPCDKVSSFNIENFIKKSGLSSSRRKLLKIFYEHRGEELDSAFLCKRLWQNAGEKEKVLYAYIHDIRSALAKEGSVVLSLERTGKGTYVFYVKENANFMSAYKTATDILIQKKRHSIQFEAASAEYINSFPRTTNSD